MERLATDSASQALYFARSMAMGIVECGWRGRKGEKRGSEEARRGGGGEKASDFRAVHGADCADCVTVSLCRQCSLPGPVRRWPAQAALSPPCQKCHQIHIGNLMLRRSAFQSPSGWQATRAFKFQHTVQYCPAKLKSEGYYYCSSKPTPALSGSSAHSIHQICLRCAYGSASPNAR
jgi:hypothetical protein